MPTLLEIGLANAICASVLAILVLGVGQVCRRPAILHGLWILVLLKLVTPPIVSVPVRVLPSEPVTVAKATPKVEVPQVAPEPEEPPVAGQFLLLPSQNDGEVMFAVKMTTLAVPPTNQEQAPPALREPAQAVEEATSNINWDTVRQALLVGWIAGSLTWFAVAAIKMIRFQRLLKYAQPAPPALQERAEELARRMGLNRCPSVSLIPGQVPPLVWMALGKPRIYLPGELVANLDETERDSLLAHELAHLRRRDHWVRWLEFVAQGIYWWFPVVALARRQMQTHEEECCDALVVNMLPARSYAQAILRTLDFLAGSEPIPATASGLSRVAEMKQRLTRIMCGGVAGRLCAVSRIALVIVALAALPMLPTLARSTANDDSTTTQLLDESIAEDDKLQPLDATHEVSESVTLTVEPLNIESTAPRRVAYSAKGDFLALALENGVIEIRNTESHQVTITMRGHAGPVNALAWSPDGATLATGSSDRTVRLWDAKTGQSKSILKGHGNWVYALAFSPDGKTIASGGYDRTVRLWNVANAKPTAILKGHSAAVRALAFASDGRTLASGGSDATICLWELPSRRLRKTLVGHAETVRSLAVSRDGQTLASAAEDGTVRLWDVRTGVERTSLYGHSGEVASLAFAPWGDVLATGGSDRVIRLWDVAQGSPLGILPAARDGIMSIVFAPVDGTLTTLGNDRQVRNIRVGRVRVTRPAGAHKELNTIMVSKSIASFAENPKDRKRSDEPFKIVLLQIVE